MFKFIKLLKKNQEKDEKSNCQEENRSINAQAKHKQISYGIALAALTILSVYLISCIQPKETKAKNTKDDKGKIATDGILSNDFTMKDSLSAQELQQRQLDDIAKELKNIQKITSDLEEEKNQREHEMQDLKRKFDSPLVFKKKNSRDSKDIKKELASNEEEKNSNSTKVEISQFEKLPPLEIVSFSYKENEEQNIRLKKRKVPTTNHEKNYKNWVPAGTFVRGVLLEGADANASVNGQSDTVPILIRLLDNGTLPNGKTSKLKDCFVLASIYGDISSERGEARLNTLSCTRKDGSILEVSVQGHLSFAGKEGIRGKPIMRNGKILAMAGMSGTLSGIGGSLQQSAQSITTSPLGTLTTVSGSQIWENGAYGGASTAMGQLAHYYIQRANQYHPIISIGSGTVATVIFQSGFSLQKYEEKIHDSSPTEAEQTGQSTDVNELNDLIKETEKNKENEEIFSNEK